MISGMKKGYARILITGSYGQGNTGDEAILTAILDQLRRRMPDARLVVVAGDTENIRRQFGVETVWWGDWAGIAQAVRQSDMVIQGGGGIFFDYSGFHPWKLFENGAPDLAHYGGFSLLANLYGKPFMVYGVGVGPLITDAGREMVKVAHSLADKITVRDVESKSSLEELGIESNRIEVTADPAFSMQPVDQDKARRILIEHGIDCSRTVIAVTARPWDYEITQSEWERSVAEPISALAQSKQAQILLIPFHKGYDDGPLLRIRELLTASEVFVLGNVPGNVLGNVPGNQYAPNEIAGVIGACDLLIGMRLHSILFAILTATPAIALAYDPKVRSLARRIEHEEICVDLADLSKLKDVIDNVWERREELSRDFARAGVELGLLSERNADLACELLNGGIAGAPSRDEHGNEHGNEHGDMFADAFYGRLQAVRVRDRMLAKQFEASEIREIIDIIAEEPQPRPSRSFEKTESKEDESLAAFLERTVTETTASLVLIYTRGYSRDGTAGLVKALAERDIPTILISGAEQAAARAILGGKSFHLTEAAMNASSDQVLSISTPRSCRRVLLLRSADLNTFRLINHAHAMNWATVYFPGRPEEHVEGDLDAHDYMVKNAEYVIVGSESPTVDMKAIDAHRVKIVAEGNSSNDQVVEILKVVADPFTKSPVRVAIEGANHG
jgi:polysaccharide pyruvyl transferase CsaB